MNRGHFKIFSGVEDDESLIMILRENTPREFKVFNGFYHALSLSLNLNFLKGNLCEKLTDDDNGKKKNLNL